MVNIQIPKFRNKRYFGLDLSESAIKLIEISKARDGYRLTKAHLVELDFDPMFDDDKKKVSVIRNGLKRLLTREKIDSGNVALSISGQSVFVRPLKIPKIAKSKIEQIIEYEAQLQVPFPINEVIWDYEVFELHDKPEMEVTLVAVKKDIVEDKLKLLAGSGLEIEHVEMDAFSLFNAINFVKDVKNKIILNIGSKITNIIIAEGHKIWTRSILIGGNDLTKAISAQLKISFKEAEKLKRKEGIITLTEKDREASPSAGQVSDAISPVLIELLTDVSKTIGYYKSQFGESKVFNEIMITGGCSRVKNIAQFVRENIDIPTRVYNILENLKADLDFAVSDEIAGRMDVAVGLALRTVMPLFTKANLLPKEVLRAKEFEKKKWYIFGSLAAAIFIFVTLTAFGNSTYKTKSAAFARETVIIERYTKYHEEISLLQGEIKDIKSRLEFIVKTSEARQRSIKAFTNAVGAMPKNIWFTELHQGWALITLKGKTTGTFDSINSFKDSLAKFAFFKNVSVEEANVSKDAGKGEDIRDFTLEIELYPLGEKPDEKARHVQSGV